MTRDPESTEGRTVLPDDIRDTLGELLPGINIADVDDTELMDAKIRSDSDEARRAFLADWRAAR